MEWEIYEERVKGISAEISGGKLKLIQSSKDTSYAVRVIIDGKVGFSAGRTVEKALENAKKTARISEEKMDSFPNEKPAKVLGIYDKTLEELKSDFLKEEYEILVNSVERATIASAFIMHGVFEVSIRNSSGADLNEKGTFSSFSIETVYGEGSGFSQCESRNRKLNIAETALYAEELAINSSKAVKIESGHYDVVLTPHAIHQLFSNTLYPSLSAENVSKGRSMLKKGSFLGELRIIDDPTIEGGIESYSFDDEGVKARRKTLVDRNVLCFYSDWKNSKEFGLTSNGIRASIDLPPSPMPSNFLIEIDEKADLDKALVIQNFIGSHTANPLSGDFSVECMNAEFDGKAIKGAMIYGNIFELLKRLEGFCSESKQVENTITPALRFERVRIV
ncbi:MAG: TldD/PmbA family protein [Archaeoglobaceae archaeon]|nr:TldD/PmbA family protein [Archaeoglobaceae archaeon]MDW8117567.1 TldD/PmbA family protein [Archaeoglobaceae archaeon]